MKKLVTIPIEFQVEWKDGEYEPTERDVEQRVLFSVVGREQRDWSITSVERFQQSFYRAGSIPSNYVCSRCGAKKVKLWRQYNTLADHIELLCGPCALEDQDKEGPIDGDGKRMDDIVGQPCDQIGWLVPAIPDEDNYTFWGYTSVPASGVRWWRALPLQEPT